VTAKRAEEEAAAKTEDEAVEGTATEIPREEAAGEKPLELVFPPPPVNPRRPPTEIPAERIGSGLNKKVRVYGLSIIRISKTTSEWPRNELIFDPHYAAYFVVILQLPYSDDI